MKNINKILQIISITALFVLFLNVSITSAQYDIGGYGNYGDVGSYGSYGDVGSYGSYGDVGSYGFPTTYYSSVPTYSTSVGSYSYPTTYYSSVPTYSTSIGGYGFPSTYYSTPTAYATSIGGYTYPSTPYSTPTAYATSVGSYDYYPFLSYSYPSTYSYLSSVPTAEAATIQPIANVSTGPEHVWLWTLLGGLMLSTTIYSALFIVRFRNQFAFTGVDANALLELKIAEIRNEELKPDTEIAIC